MAINVNLADDDMLVPTFDGNPTMTNLDSDLLVVTDTRDGFCVADNL
jgi:hypothetical protein